MAKLNDVLKNIRKDIGATEIDKSVLADVVDFLDTGSYAINRVVTGDIHGGFPVGRITTLFGLSQSGKSLITSQTVINALKNKKVDVVYIFDSEGGVLVDTFRRSGVDMSKINHIPVVSVEQCAVKMLSLYDSLVQAKKEYEEDPENNDNIKALCILDSYGALSSEKLINDATKKDQMVQDMGLTPKLKNNLMRGLMMRVPLSGATLIVVNHEWQDPSAMFSSKIHNMAGGKGIEFASHVILQCERVFVKAGDTDFMTGNESDDDDVGFYKGNKLKFFTAKNRIVKPMFTASVYVDFNSGIPKYDGLVDDAEKYGYIEKVRGGYIVPSYSDKRVSFKDLVSKDEIWNTFIEDFNERSKRLLSYSNGITAELDQIENETKKSARKQING